MEFKQVIGDRSTIRFFDPDKPVEPEKIQIMLEAANRSSRAVNADFVKAVVVFRDDLDDETWEKIKTPTTTVQPSGVNSRSASRCGSAGMRTTSGIGVRASSG